jgi:hypothetical protein
VTGGQRRSDVRHTTGVTEALSPTTSDDDDRASKETIMFGQKTSFKRFVFTFGTGLITGVAIGLLYAPITGKKMQKKVADATDRVMDKVDDLQHTVRKIANA